MKSFSHVSQYLAEFFVEWEVFKTNIVEKTKPRILCSVTFFRKLCRLWDNVEKCRRAREAAHDNMAARRMPDW